MRNSRWLCAAISKSRGRRPKPWTWFNWGFRHEWLGEVSMTRATVTMNCARNSRAWRTWWRTKFWGWRVGIRCDRSDKTWKRRAKIRWCFASTCWDLDQPKNTTLDHKQHTKKKTKIYEIRQDAYIYGAEEIDLLTIYIKLQEDLQRFSQELTQLED